MVNRRAIWQLGKLELAKQKRGGVVAGRSWEHSWRGLGTRMAGPGNVHGMGWECARWGHLHRKERTGLFQGAEREQCGPRVEAGSPPEQVTQDMG